MEKRKNILPFRVFYGGEDFFLDRELSRVRKWKGREVTILDGRKLGEDALISEVEASSFDGTPRLVIVDDAQKIKGDKALRQHIAARDVQDVSVVLVVFIHAEKLPEVWSFAAGQGKATVAELKKLKTWETDNQVVDWIEQEAAKVGLKLEKKLSNTLFDWVGGDLYRLASEIHKLALYVGKNRAATNKDLAATLAPSQVASALQVADAAMDRDTRKAMNLLSTYYKTQGDEVHVPIVKALMEQVEKAMLARQLLDKGTTTDDIALVIGRNPWWCKTFFVPRVRRHDLSALAKHMADLCKLDANVKGPSHSKRTFVELTVLSISGG